MCILCDIAVCVGFTVFLCLFMSRVCVYMCSLCGIGGCVGFMSFLCLMFFMNSTRDNNNEFLKKHIQVTYIYTHVFSSIVQRLALNQNKTYLLKSVFYYVSLNIILFYKFIEQYCRMKSSGKNTAELH